MFNARQRLERRIRRAEQQLDALFVGDFGRYHADPVGYCREVLRVTLTPDQEAIARGVVTPPYRVLAPSAHTVGKSYVAACLVNWWYDTRSPGICLTTAPNKKQVCDILWKEVRKLRRGAGLGGFPGPKAPRLESAPDHFAHGFTARDGASFQGHHESSVFVIFDEAEGVESHYWEAAHTMLGPSDPFLAIYNPIRQDTQAYIEEQSPGYRVLSISAMQHPNIAAELDGKSPPFPAAIRLSRLRELLTKWATPLIGEQPKPSDVCLGGQWWRPGPIAECRLLGRRPSQSVNAVWPVFAWQRAETTILPDWGPLQLGCDVARFGDDFTAWHGRRGGTSLLHESVNGWDTMAVAERCKQLAHQMATACNAKPADVLIAVDDIGVGGGVTDALRRDGYAVCGLNTANKWEGPDFPTLRSALWCGLAEEAATGNVSVIRLPDLIRLQLRRELTAVTYSLDLRGRRVVEPKDVTKRRLGRSPDNADSMLLAYANINTIPDRLAGRVEVPR